MNENMYVFIYVNSTRLPINQSKWRHLDIETVCFNRSSPSIFSVPRSQRAMMESDRFQSQLRCPAGPSPVVLRPAWGVQLAGRDWTQLAAVPALGDRESGSQVCGNVAVAAVSS